MTKTINLTGQKFNLLTVICEYDSTSVGVRWLCICDCGKQSVVNSLKLRRGFTKSCGCVRAARVLNFVHGLANKSRTYRTWKEMRNRCNNPNATQYKWYGGKGIRVCPEWDDYTVFLSDMGDRPEGKTIDRLDNSLGYSRSNCRWATPKEQAENNSGCFRKAKGVASR